MNRFATHLSSVFHPTTDVAVMEVAAEVLGHLVRARGGRGHCDAGSSPMHDRSQKHASQALRLALAPRRYAYKPSPAQLQEFNRSTPPSPQVRSGGALTAEVVDHEVKRSLTWLQGERVEVKRYAAVLLLKEMAENAPAVFNVHVRSFIEQVGGDRA